MIDEQRARHDYLLLSLFRRRRHEGRVGASDSEDFIALDALAVLVADCHGRFER